MHVVCSCREFERRRDARLTAIDADTVELSLPTWEQVGEVLATRGINAAGWPEPFRELLRPPQHLKVFLQGLGDPSEARVFGSYQQMLDDLWAKRVTDPHGSPERSDLLMDLATAMAEDETLWVPAVRFEERQGLVEMLVGAGVLAWAGTGTGLGFSHQTLFEHAWARAFARQRCSLADYAMARQNGLFVRSTVWSGLNYLRGADPAGYRREFGRLWVRDDLRRHLRHLLVEFLGMVRDPSVQEEAWLFGAVADPALEPRVLTAVRGNPAWFARLTTSHLPRLMREAGDGSGLLLGVLIAAWPFAREECLRLVRDEWLPDQAKDFLLFHVLTQLPTWDEATVGMASEIIGRTPINRASAMHLAAQVVETAPDLAPRVVAAVLRREIEIFERQPDPDPEPLPGDATDIQRFLQAMTYRSKECFRRLIENGNDWYGMEEIAERSPRSFIHEVWPLFIRALEPLLGERRETRNCYREDHCLAFALPDGDADVCPHPFPESIDRAIRSLAADAPNEFEAFLDAERGTDSKTVQRLLVRGLTAGLPQTHGLAVRYLLEDDRRFELGPFSDEYRDSVALLAALGPRLSINETRALEQSILGWNVMLTDAEENDPGWRREAQRINRRHRLRLLAALPFERLTEPARNLIGQEQVRFPDHEAARIHRIEGGLIGSPMSAAQMQHAKNADILRLFRLLTDATGHNHPRHFIRGGSIQAAREFETFATACPDRAVAILPEFQPGQQERPTGAALVGLAKSVYPDRDLFELIFTLDDRGFRSEEFRVDAARALEQRLRDRLGLPDCICELLERWLSEPWQQVTVTRSDRRERDEGPVASVLWQSGGVIGIPQGTFTLLRTLTYGYLLRQPPASDRWLAAIESHTDRPERVETWQVFSREFRHLRFCDKAAAVRFLDRLFARHPDVLASDFAASMLTSVWWFAPDADVWRWLALLRGTAWDKAAQAYGELITLRAVSFGDSRARDEIQFHTGSMGSPLADTAQVQPGIAAACSRPWFEPAGRGFVTDTILRMIPQATGRLARTILEAFTFSDSLPADDATRRLLAALIEHPGVLAYLGDGQITERLEALLPEEAEAVYHVCRELVRHRRDDLRSVASGWSLNAANLTTISLTLQRMGAGMRELGLDLFESLLDAGLPDAESTLREIDRRIPSPAQGIMPRPRRRRRRRTA